MVVTVDLEVVNQSTDGPKKMNLVAAELRQEGRMQRGALSEDRREDRRLGNHDDEQEKILEEAWDGRPNVPPPVDESDPFQEVERLDFSFCSVKIGKDSFRPAPFRVSKQTEKRNRRAIRFGGTNDIMTLIEGTATAEEQTDYLIGLVASSVVMSCFFVLWVVIILVMKYCFSYRHCGFLSGRFVRRPQPPTSASPVDDKNHNSAASPSSSEMKTTIPLASSKLEEIELVEKSSTQEESTTGIQGQDEKKNGSDGESDKDQITAAEATNGKFDREQGQKLGSQELSEPNHNDSITEKETPQRSDEDAVNLYEQWVQSCADQERRLLRVRVVLVLSSLLLCVAGILFCVYGTRYVQKTLDTVNLGLRHIQELCSGGVELIAVFMERQQETTKDLDQVFVELNNGGLCPRVREQICTSSNITENKSEFFDCSFEGIPFISASLEKVFTLVYDTRLYLYDELDRLQRDLQDRSDDIDELLESEQSLEWAFWIAFSFVLALIVCCFFIIYHPVVGIYKYYSNHYYNERQQEGEHGNDDNQNDSSFNALSTGHGNSTTSIAMAKDKRQEKPLNRCQRCFRRQIIFPFFCFLTFMAFVFANTFLIASIATSDWCINSPDPKVSTLLDRVFLEMSDGSTATTEAKKNDFLDDPTSIDLESVIYQFAQYYVNSCASELRPLKPSEQVARLRSVLNAVNEFTADVASVQIDEDTTTSNSSPTNPPSPPPSSSLDDENASWQSICGNDGRALRSFTTVVQEVTCLLTLTLEDVNRFFWCRQWNPIYTIMMHDGICYDAQDGLSSVASSNLVIVFCAFIILFLRAGAFDIEEEEDYLREVRRCRVFLYRTVTCKYCREKKQSAEDNESVKQCDEQSEPGDVSIAGNDDHPDEAPNNDNMTAADDDRNVDGVSAAEVVENKLIKI